MTNTEFKKIEARIATLTERYQALMVMEQTPIIQDIIGEYMQEVERLHYTISNKREYLYNFVGGGWNSEWAYTENQAYAQAMERWGDDSKLRIDPKSFRESTPKDYANLLSLFY